MGLSRRWENVEVAYLKRHAGDKSLTELAARLRSDEATVAQKIEELRLRAVALKEPEIDPLEAYQRGTQALYAGHWEEAIAAFEDAAREGYGDMAARARQFADTARARAAAAAAATTPEDPWVKAVFEKNRGRLEEALALCAAEGRAEQDDRFAYLAAVICARQGELEAAGRHLARAIELDPHNRAHALHDPDLAAIREQLGA
jgi:tetratricopeptide (TPR) repeat protein